VTDGQTDRRTDRNPIANTRLSSTAYSTTFYAPQQYRQVLPVLLWRVKSRFYTMGTGEAPSWTPWPVRNSHPVRDYAEPWLRATFNKKNVAEQFCRSCKTF